LAKNSEDISATSEIVSLKDSVSLCRIKNPGRSSACPHTQCFDLGVYFELNKNQDKFKCPVCNQERAWSTLVFDEFFKEILDAVSSEDDEKVQIEPDGKWEVFKKNSGSSTSSANVTRQSSAMDIQDGPEELFEKKRAKMDKDVEKFLVRAQAFGMINKNDEVGASPLRICMFPD
jgi:E3 SUMO-protein ligase PIAS1